MIRVVEAQSPERALDEPETGAVRRVALRIRRESAMRHLLLPGEPAAEALRLYVLLEGGYAAGCDFDGPVPGPEGPPALQLATRLLDHQPGSGGFAGLLEDAIDEAVAALGGKSPAILPLAPASVGSGAGHVPILAFAATSALRPAFDAMSGHRCLALRRAGWRIATA